MNRKLCFIILILVLLFVIGGVFYYNTFLAGKNEPNTNSDIITPISIESVKGITANEAEQLCYNVLGEKDEKTGFTFSFGVSGAVEKAQKQYYVVRVSWLVDNSHLSYIGDFFVSNDGKEIYNGVAMPDEYIMENVIWSK